MTVTKKGNEVKDSYTVSLKGTLPSSTVSYELYAPADPIPLSKSDIDNEYAYFSPISNKITTTYSLPTATVCGKNSTVTLNKKSATSKEGEIHCDLYQEWEYDDWQNFIGTFFGIEQGAVVNGINCHNWFRFITEGGYTVDDPALVDGCPICKITCVQAKSSKRCVLNFVCAPGWQNNED